MSPERSRVYAIVPAAGRSRRIGRAKQMLAVAGRPMLLSVLEPLAVAQVAGVVLVTHRAIADQLQRERMLAAWPRVFLARNEDEHSEMIDSVRIGLRAWLEREAIADQDGFLVCPGDHPGISAADFDACIVAYRAAPDRIVIACRGGQRGHPLIFPAALATFVQSTACDRGLNVLARSFPERIAVIECQSPGVTRDVDSPADYDRLP